VTLYSTGISAMTNEMQNPREDDRGFHVEIHLIGNGVRVADKEDSGRENASRRLRVNGLEHTSTVHQ